MSHDFCFIKSPLHTQAIIISNLNYYSVFKDLDREIQGHQPNIERVLVTGERLLNDKHSNSKAIKDKCQELQLSWDDLLKKSKNRKKNMDISLQTQKVSTA